MRGGTALDLARLVLGRGVDLGRLTAVLAERWGDRPAVETDEPPPGLGLAPVMTFREVEEAVARLAAALRAGGVAPGQTVLVSVGSRLDGFLHVLALARVGAVAAPVNPHLKGDELRAIVEATGATAAVVVVEPAADEHGDPLEGLARLECGAPDRGFCLVRWLEEHPGERLAPGAADPERVAVNLATSGTTGRPKAAALTSRGLLVGPGRLVGLPLWDPREDGSTPWSLLAALPLYHVMGLTAGLSALCAGLRWVHRARFDPAEALDLLAAGRASLFVGVPTMYADLEAAGAADRDLSAVHLWCSGADVMPPERARRFQGYGSAFAIAGRGVGSAAFVDVYGMVELSGAAAVRLYPPSPGPALPLPVPAVALPGVEVRAVDEGGRPVRLGRVGELQFRGASVLREYRGRGPASDEAGWFSTGDYGRIGPGPTFLFSGRRRDRLKVAGFSVFPAEVEAILGQHPDVAEVAVVGLPDPRIGESPTALVVPRGRAFDGDAFLAWARDHVAGYRRPRAAFAVDALPRGGNRKLDRAAATRMAEELAAR